MRVLKFKTRPDHDLVALVFIVISVIFLASFLQGCKSVPIPDTEWCGDKGKLGASCFHTLSAGERALTKEQWDAEREQFGMLCTIPDSFASFKEIIEKLCHETSDCDYQAVSKFLDRASKNKRKP